MRARAEDSWDIGRITAPHSRETTEITQQSGSLRFNQAGVWFHHGAGQRCGRTRRPSAFRQQRRLAANKHPSGRNRLSGVPDGAAPRPGEWRLPGHAGPSFVYQPTTKAVAGTVGGVLFWPTGVAILGYVAVKKIRAGKNRETREVVYSQAWQRDDPIVQLPPGATHEQSYSMTCGISETQTRELTRSLGLKLRLAGALTGELSSKFGIATTVSEQRSITDTVMLRNEGTQAYRLYARWFVRHELTVQRLEVPDEPARESGRTGGKHRTRRSDRPGAALYAR